MTSAPRSPLSALALSVGVTALAAFGPLLSRAYAAYTFTKIADTATTAPGSAEPFSGFTDVCYDGQNVAFIGYHGFGFGVAAIYQSNGVTLNRVIGRGDPMPSSDRTFSDFANLALDNGHIAFQGGNSSLHEGVYTNLGGSLRRVADTTTTMPGSAAVFSDLLNALTPLYTVALDGQTVVFSGFGTFDNGHDMGVYREADGVLSAVANRSTRPPGNADPFFSFDYVDVDGSDVVFDGYADEHAVWTTRGAAPGPFRKVFDSSTQIPDLAPLGNLFFRQNLSIDQGQIGMIISDDGSMNDDGTFQDYLYIDSNGAFRKIAADGDMNPITNTPFALDHLFSFDNGRVLFGGSSQAGTESIQGIYLSNDTGFDPIISDLDTLDGKNLTDVRVFKNSLAGVNFAFEATFSDGSSGIYLADEEGVIGTPQMISIEPTFDVQLRPGNQFPIGDGQTTLAIDGGLGVSFPVMQVLAEFPLSGIPEGAQITSAQLKLDATTTGANNLTINASGYAGDGLASLSDEQAATTLLGSEAGPFTIAGDVTIELDPNFIASLLGGDSSHLGLRLASATSGPFINIAALEHATGVAPTLVVNFTTASAGADFDQDTDVDGNDFILWQLGLGSQYDEGDFAAWQSTFGPGTPASVAAASVPEPASVAMLAAGLLGAVLANGRRAVVLASK